MIPERKAKQCPSRLYKKPVSRKRVLRTLAELIEHARLKIYVSDIPESERLSWARVLTSALSSATASLKYAARTRINSLAKGGNKSRSLVMSKILDAGLLVLERQKRTTRGLER